MFIIPVAGLAKAAIAVTISLHPAAASHPRGAPARPRPAARGAGPGALTAGPRRLPGARRAGYPSPPDWVNLMLLPLARMTTP